jgi:hypothetical protein
MLCLGQHNASIYYYDSFNNLHSVDLKDVAMVRKVVTSSSTNNGRMSSRTFELVIRQPSKDELGFLTDHHNRGGGGRIGRKLTPLSVKDMFAEIRRSRDMNKVTPDRVGSGDGEDVGSLGSGNSAPSHPANSASHTLNSTALSTPMEDHLGSESHHSLTLQCDRCVVRSVLSLCACVFENCNICI